MKKEIKFSLIAITIFQILIIMNMCVANSYIIHQSNKSFDKIISSDEEAKQSLINSGLNLLIGIFTIKQIGTVSAEDEKYLPELDKACCLETKDGAICQDTVRGEAEECAVSLIMTECKDIVDCKLGCCIDDEEGICSENSPKERCEQEEGEWEDDEACNTEECQNGCCVLGGETIFNTMMRCEKLSKFYGFEMDFRQQVKTEAECVLMKRTGERGACVFEGKACKTGTQAECDTMGGKYYGGLLCSNPLLNTSCKRQDYVSCVEGRDEIYWFDSCGNRENIYSSNRDASWQNGTILTKEESCGAGTSNAESPSCGNCDYLLGSVCDSSKPGGPKVEDGKFICKDLNCKNTVDGTDRVNGESWCMYDGQIGEGKDTVGSRHWKHQCIDGEEVIDGCADFRQEICVENKVTGLTGEISFAGCVINEWRNCYAYNDNEDREAMVEKCEANDHCFVQEVWKPLDEDHEDYKGPVKVCLPYYPPGLKFYGDEMDSGGKLCNFATQEIEILSTKRCTWGVIPIGAKYVCEVNCDADTQEFTQSMSKWCISIGDCGAYTNFVGEVTTEGFKEIGETPKLTEEYIAGLAQYQIPNPTVTGKLSNQEPSEEEEFGKDGWAKVIGGSGTLLGLGWKSGGWLGGLGLETGAEATAITTANMFLSTLGAGLAGAAAGLIIWYLFDLPKEAAYTLSIVGALAGIVANIVFKLIGVIHATAWAIVFAIALAFLLGFLAKLFGCGDVKSEDAGAMCDVWVQPEGGEDCELCNEPEIHTCTEYRCKSLGAACEIIGEDTESPKCFWKNRNDASPPVITPWEEILTQGYAYESLESCLPNCNNRIKELYTTVEGGGSGTESNISGEGIGGGESDVEPPSNAPPISPRNGTVQIPSEDGCISPYQKITVGVTTDEIAKCSFGFSTSASAALENSISGNYGKKHQTTISFPSIVGIQQELESESSNSSSNQSEGYQGDEAEIEAPLVDLDQELRLFVTCEDGNGNGNSIPLIFEMCMGTGPDLTPPIILSINPGNERKIKYNATSQFVEMYVNEPAECRYAMNDTSYDLMPNNFTCKTSMEDETIDGWLCTTKMTNLEDENTYYIRCKDQPYAKSEAIRNANQESYIYNMPRTTELLNITSIKPEGTISEGFEPMSVNLEVETSGGAENGKAICYYNFNKFDNEYQFFDTFSYLHNQYFSSMVAGKYDVYIFCEDYAGNTAQKKGSFMLKTDEDPPTIVRVYYNGDLNLITDEQAECYYTFDKCNFNIKNATSMTTALSTEHSTSWNPGLTYYVKCVDSWGNYPNSCSMKILPNLYN